MIPKQKRTKKLLKPLVKNSTSYSEIAVKLGFSRSSGRIVKEEIINYNIDTSHFNKCKYTKEMLEPIVKNNISVAGVLRDLGLNNTSGGNHSHISKKIKEYKIDTSHFKGQAHLKGKTHNWTKKKPLSEIMIKNSTYSRSHLKTRILKNKLIEYKCSICEMGPEWNDMKLVLALDHINGVGNDHRLKNLRFLCPNCHSQTESFAGHKNKKPR